MPGLFAVISKNGIEDKSLNRAIDSLYYEPWFKMSRYDPMNGTVSLGRLSNNILNPEQPKLSKDGQFVAFIDGEIYNSRQLWSEIGEAGLDSKNDADLILALNRLDSPLSWLPRCEGSFTLMIWDNKSNTLIVANDRFGLRPHYYTWDGRNFIFGPEIKFIMSFPWVSKTLNLSSVTEYFAFQCILGDKTFFEKIYTLPYASLLKVDLNEEIYDPHIEHYWDFNHVKSCKEISFDEAAEQVAYLFGNAVRKRTESQHRYGIYLSAGLDSRMILGSYPKEKYPVQTFTFGLKNCRDHVYTERMSRRLGVEHHTHYYTSGVWLKEVAEKHLRLTEGFHCLFHAHGFDMAPIARDYIDINLSGFYGDLLLGGSKVKPYFISDQTDWSSIKRNLYHYNLETHGIGFLTDYELRQLFTDQIWETPERLPAWECMERAFEPFMEYGFENSTDFFHIINRGRKMLEYFLVFTRPYLEDREPFYDYQLFDFIYSIPASYRLNRRLQIAVLERIAPPLATIPLSNNDELPTNRQLISKLWVTGRKFRKGLYDLSNGRFFQPLDEYYQDYNGWLRNDIYTWVRSILEDRKVADRKIVNPEFVQSVLNQHLSGNEDCTYKIGLMLTFEMMLRHLAD